MKVSTFLASSRNSKFLNCLPGMQFSPFTVPSTSELTFHCGVKVSKSTQSSVIKAWACFNIYISICCVHWFFCHSAGITRFFVCSRSGEYRPHGDKAENKSGKTRERRSKKTGQACPAHIRLTRSTTSGTCTAIFFPVHIGHSTELADSLRHMPLPISVKEQVRTKLQLGISDQRIIQGKLSCLSSSLSSKC